MPFTVYFNRVHRSARVHRSTCGYLKMHGGVSRNVPPTGWYEEGFCTAEDAKEATNKTKYETRNCKVCLG